MDIVYTGLFGDIDAPPPIALPGGPFVKYVLFSDRQVNARGWEVRVIQSKLHHRMQARECKIHSYKYFPNARQTVWIDANIRMKITIRALLSRFAQWNVEYAAAKHPDRDCVYDEIEACEALLKDSRARLEQQRWVYLDMGFPKHAGLADNGLIIRRHSAQILALENQWWDHIRAYSIRDQVSLPIVRSETRTSWHLFDPRGVYERIPHMHAR